ncbi:MAG: hypothetical protein RL324_152 [Verrucomicrobiota bacterium]|jgi:hypothetical protein
MPSLLKKKAEASTSQVPAWHPNFRNYQKLPDIKVVRTAFFINGFAALIAIGLVVGTVVREFELYKKKESIAQIQAQIDKDEPESKKAIALFNKFKEEEKRANDVEVFVKSRPLFSEILQRFAETRPKNVAIKGIDLRENGIVLRVGVRGDAVTANTDHVNYVELLKKVRFLTDNFDPAEIKAANTDPTTGHLEGEIHLAPKTAAKEPAKK